MFSSGDRWLLRHFSHFTHWVCLLCMEAWIQIKQTHKLSTHTLFFFFLYPVQKLYFHSSKTFPILFSWNISQKETSHWRASSDSFHKDTHTPHTHTLVHDNSDTAPNETLLEYFLDTGFKIMSSTLKFVLLFEKTQVLLIVEDWVCSLW